MNNLNTKVLLCIVPVIVVTILGLGVLAYTELGRQKERVLLGELEFVSEQASQNSIAFDRTLNNAGGFFADSSAVKRFVFTHGTDSHVFTVPRFQRKLSGFREKYTEIRHIQIFRPEKNGDCSALIAVPHASLDQKASERLCREMVSGNLDLHNAFEIDTGNKKSFFVYGIRFDASATTDQYFSRTRDLNSILVLTKDSELFASTVINDQNIFAGKQFLVDDAGRLAHHNDTDRIGSLIPATSDILKIANDSSDPVKHDTRHGLTLLPDFEGQISLADTRKLKNSLTLVTIMPLSEFEFAYREMIPALALITLIAILVTSLVLWVALRAMVIAPIQQLKTLASSYGEGNFELGVMTRRGDEIGELENAFYDMGIKLVDAMQIIRKSHHQIEQLAYTDGVTELPNRRGLLVHLDQIISDSETVSSQARIAVYFMDIDDFKRINDLLGHEAGDALLREFGTRLDQWCSRAGTGNRHSSFTMAGRMGGDEFVAISSEASNEQEIATRVELLQGILAVPVQLGQHEFVVSSSIGVAVYPDHATTANELLKCADTAMYEVKLNKKNGFCLFNDEMANKVANQVQLENDLRTAIEREQLYLVYQPQLFTSTEAVSGVEALLRWSHHEKGNIAPDIFIPIAEQCGLIGAIGHWVIDQACAQWRRWQEMGIEPSRIAINVSQRQLSQVDLTDQILQALARHDIPAFALELEVTESCIMEAPAQVIATIEALRAKGIRVAIDDFGTGYSSLSSLAVLPVDTIKLDRCFATDICNQADNQRIVSAVLYLAREFNLETIAEGVETEAEKQYFKKVSCDVLQGYLLSHPLNSDNATRWLLDNHGRSELEQVA